MPFFEPQVNCWKLAHADSCDVLIDAENYFRSVRREMAQAEQRIILIGWDFDARVKMYDTCQPVEGPLEIGDYIDWLIRRNPKLHIYILQWNMGALKMLGRGRTLLKLARWYAHPRIHLKLDGAHPTGAAQHEKIIVVDHRAAFCGGIDITEERWDTRMHRDEEERRKQPNDKDFGPWHDVSTVLRGAVVADFSDLAEQRWQRVSGSAPRPVTTHASVSLATSPESDPAAVCSALFNNVTIAIARTRGACQDQEEIREIERLYCGIIAAAQNHIYIESQYFTSRHIAAAIAKRLDEDGGPEIVLVMPATVQGWLESQVMDTTRKRLIEALRRRDHQNRFRVYHPVTLGGADIYVHAKVVVADDRFLRVGSSNMSNRSMGFDSECDICIDALHAADPDAISAAIMQVRNDLIAEHLGCQLEEIGKIIEKTGSLIHTIEMHNLSAKRLRRYEAPELNGMQQWLAENDILDPHRADDEYPDITLTQYR